MRMPFAFVLFIVASAENTGAIRVLFVGNSFTFVNDLPHQLINIAKSLGEDVVVANSTVGGCSLYYQEAGSDEKTQELLQQPWDFIVLQDCKRLGILCTLQCRVFFWATYVYLPHTPRF